MGVLKTRAPLFRAYVRASDFWKLPLLHANSLFKRPTVEAPRLWRSAGGRDDTNTTEIPR